MRSGQSSSTSAFLRPKDWPTGLIVVVVWSLIVRVIHLIAFFGNSPFSDTLVSDAYIFESWGARIADGDWAGDPRPFVLPPLYPYLIGMVYTVSGRIPEFIILLQSTLGVISAGLVWRIAGRRFGGVAGIAAGILFGSAGSILFYESMLVGTSVAIFLTVLFLCFWEQWSREEALLSLGMAGFFLGLLAVLRPNFLLVAPVILVSTVWRARKLGYRKVLRSTIVFLFLTGSPFLVLLVRNGVIAGEWTPLSSHGGINFYMGNHAGAPGWFSPPPGMAANITPREPEGNLVGPRRLAEAEMGHTLTDREVSDYWFAKGIAFVVTDPFEATPVFYRKIRLFLSAYEVPLNYSYEYHRTYANALNIPFGQLWFLYPLGIVGGLVALSKRKSCSGLILFLLSYASGVILFHVSTRYRMPILPVLTILGGYAVQSLVESARAKQRASFAREAILLAVLVAFFVYERSMWDVSRDRSMDPFNLGTSHLYEGQFDRAVPYLEEARQAGGQFPSLYYNLGVSYAGVGRPDDAVSAYIEALSIDPQLVAALTNLGNLHFQAARYPEAEESYRSALAAHPNALNSRAALGWIHFTFHRDDSARVEWTTVLKMDPQNVSALGGMKRLQSPP
jgi:tetratricopeptide (TPR) repeat protein